MTKIIARAQAAGIKTVLEGAERPVVLKRVYADYDFDATLQNYSTSGDPALGIARAYTSEAIHQGQTFNNASGYSNREVDALFDQGRDALQSKQEEFLAIHEQRFWVSNVTIFADTIIVLPARARHPHSPSTDYQVIGTAAVRSQAAC